jgi:glycosyltransferase involved in cell wall biosynthesis
MNKPALNVLNLFDYGKGVHTGYSRVSSNLVPRFKKIFGNTETQAGIVQTIVGLNYFGERQPDGILRTWYEEDKFTTVVSGRFSVPVNSNPEAVDEFGKTGFLNILQLANLPQSPEDIAENLKNGKPVRTAVDGIFIIQDAGIINPIVPLLERMKSDFRQQNRKSFKSIFYFPCDNPMLDLMLDKLNFFDLLITYNEYSREAILRHRPELKPKLRVIPHGIDQKEFYPLPETDKASFRSKYFGENAGKFIVLNLNRNQPRKDIPCTILGFIEFKKDHPDSFLYLHMNPNDPLGYDLRIIMSQTDLIEGQDYMFPPAEKENHGFSVAELNQIYNACDVYITTTKGEGWGLAVTEAMACRLPVICPMNTSFIEIGDQGRRVYALDGQYPVCTAEDNIIREQCDPLEVGNRLAEVKDHLATSSPVLQEKVQAAYEYVSTLGWDGIAEKFAAYFRETF